MQPYPKFFDDYEEKHAFVGALARFGLPMLQRAGGKLMQQGPSAAWNYLSRMGARYAPRAAQAAGAAAPKTWGQWGWGAAKNVGGMAGTMMAADTLMNGLGWGGQAQGADPNSTASMAMLQAAMNSPDPQHRMAAQQYLQQNFGFPAGGFQQQNPADMSLNGLMARFGSGQSANPEASSPFYQPPSQQQTRTVYVPMMPEGTPQPGQPQQMAARPAEGQPPSPVNSTGQLMAARPAEGQPPAPAPAQAPAAAPAPAAPQMAARPAAGQPPAPAPRPMAAAGPASASPGPTPPAAAAARPPSAPGAGPAAGPVMSWMDWGTRPGMSPARVNPHTPPSANVSTPIGSMNTQAIPPRVQAPQQAPGLAASSVPAPAAARPMPSMTARRPSYADTVPVPAAGRPGGQPTPIGTSQQVQLQPAGSPAAVMAQPKSEILHGGLALETLPPRVLAPKAQPGATPTMTTAMPDIYAAPPAPSNDDYGRMFGEMIKTNPLLQKTSVAPLPWFLRSKEAAAGRPSFFRKVS